MGTLKFYFLLFGDYYLHFTHTTFNPIAPVEIANGMLLFLPSEMYLFIFCCISLSNLRHISSRLCRSCGKWMEQNGWNIQNLPNVHNPTHYTGTPVKNSLCWGNRVKCIIVLKIESTTCGRIQIHGAFCVLNRFKHNEIFDASTEKSFENNEFSRQYLSVVPCWFMASSTENRTWNILPTD